MRPPASPPRIRYHLISASIDPNPHNRVRADEGGSAGPTAIETSAPVPRTRSAPSFPVFQRVRTHASWTSTTQHRAAARANAAVAFPPPTPQLSGQRGRRPAAATATRPTRLPQPVSASPGQAALPPAPTAATLLGRAGCKGAGPPAPLEGPGRRRPRRPRARTEKDAVVALHSQTRKTYLPSLFRLAPKLKDRHSSSSRPLDWP